MPNTGTPIASSAGSAAGASASYTEHGPPERISPSGFSARTCSIGTVQGSTTENTLNSRILRAISWVYCDPKSRMTIVEVSTKPIVNGRETPTPQIRKSVRIFLTSAHDAGHNPNAKQDYSHSHDVSLRDMHQMRQIRDTGNQNEVTNGINSKGHGHSPGRSVKAAYLVRCQILKSDRINRRGRSI